MNRCLTLIPVLVFLAFPVVRPDRACGVEVRSIESLVKKSEKVISTPQEPGPGPDALSDFEGFVSGMDLETMRGAVRQFGYDLFERPPSTFAPVDRVPVGPDYVIGPGDEIRISVWGRIEGNWTVLVDRDGNVSLPKIGTIGVTGLSFEQLKGLLHRQFAKYYKDFEMSVSMGALRTIRVYVVGFARRPGAYTVSSLSTLVNALFEAGGPGKRGTLRDIQVKRNGETIVSFDFYDFLLRGDKTRDIRLMPEDVIFIPPIGPVAAVEGSVKKPAIYELKGETTVARLIEMAGGPGVIAFKGRVRIERIVDDNLQVVMESSFPEIEREGLTIHPGDVVRIFHIVEDRQLVTINGAVHRSGSYGISDGMTVRELVEKAGGLRYNAYTKETELTRVRITNEGPVTEKIKFDLGKALAGDPGENLGLQNNDYVQVRTVPEWELYKIVTVEGEVRFPGTYTISKGETLASLLERAGGFTERAFLRGAVFTRESVRQIQQKQINEMVARLERELLGMGSAEVGAAITAEEAEIMGVELKQKRAFVEALKGVRATGRMVLSVAPPEVLRDTPSDIELEGGDSLFVPRNPQTVQVVGAVYNETAFIYDERKSYKDYVKLTGGYTENADKKHSYVLKVDGTAVRMGAKYNSMSWNGRENRWEFAPRKGLEPGDTIVVPEKLRKVAWMREIKDITQILYQIAVSAGVLIVAF